MTDASTPKRRTPLWYVCVAMASLAGIAIVVLMGVTIADIVGRNLALFYILGVIEISTLTLILLGYFAFPLKFLVDGQIAVDLFTLRLSARTNRRLDSVWLVVTGLFFLAIAYPVLDNGLRIHAEGERTTNMEWSPLVFVIPVFVGAIVTAVVCIVTGIRRFFGAETPEADADASPGL
jgi:TRAP-type C4-dicarboxylate transport system permease small subunit